MYRYQKLKRIGDEEEIRIIEKQWIGQRALRLPVGSATEIERRG
jgi:hypothetical protein